MSQTDPTTATEAGPTAAEAETAPAVDATVAPTGSVRSRRRSERARSASLFTLGVIGGLATWWAIAAVAGQHVVSSPLETWSALLELQDRGTLWEAVRASSVRLLWGWGLGLVVGIPVGVLLGRSKILRALTDPYVQFLRFIPPIAFIPLTIIWLGIGESSKIVLIFYTSVFIVTINTMAGVRAVDVSRLRAAASLGAGRTRRLLVVILPSTVPFLFTGARLAMGNAFLTIVSAELVAAQTGVGALIWQARNFGRIDWVFAGILLLGVMGLVADLALRLFGRYALRRFSIHD